MKIRKDNDFVFNWAINWNGIAEDFTGATDMVLTASVFGIVKTIPDESYSIIGNIVRIEFTTEICNIPGVYRIDLKYSKPSSEFVDGERRSAVDVKAFKIVETSDNADTTHNLSSTSDAVAGFALKYEDLTAEQKEELRGKGITSIELSTQDGDTKTYTITYADGETFDFDVIDGHSPVFTFNGTTLVLDGVPQVDLKGETGNGIASIELTSTAGLVKTYTITFTDATTATFTVTDGSTPAITFQGTTIYVNGVAGPNLKGEIGKGISAVTLLSTAGLAKTYRITFTDSTTFDYVVTDGAAGVGAAVVQTTGASINDVMSQKAVTDDLALKASHGYDSNPKTLKQVDDSLVQLAGNLAEFRGTLTAANNLDDIDDRGVYMVNSTITPGTYPSGISTYLLLRVINAGSGTSSFRYQILMEMGSPGLKSRVWGRGAYNATSYANSWTGLSNIDYYKGVITQTSNIDDLAEYGSYVLGSVTAKPLGTYPVDYDSTKNAILVNMFATASWKIQLLGQLGKTWMREGTNTWRRTDNIEYSYFKATLGASDDIDTRLIEGAALINTTLTPGTYPVNVSLYCIIVQNGSGNFWHQTLYEIDKYKRTSAWIRTYQNTVPKWNEWVQIANPTTPEPVNPSQPLFGKKMLFFGDSITEGAGGLNNYPQYVGTRTGATITNVGIGGTQMANHIAAPTYNPFSFCNLVTSITTNTWTTQDANASAAGATEQLALLKTLDLSTFNFIVIAYGHNDRSNGVVVGLESSTSNDEFYGALNNSVNTLLTAYPNLHIIYIAPYDRPSAPGTMQPFTDAVINVAKKNAMPVLDLLRISGINAKTASYYLEDGLHPKLDFGYEFLGQKIGAFISSVI